MLFLPLRMREVACPGTRMPKMEKSGVYIPTSSEPATPLQVSQEIGEADAEYLASRITCIHIWVQPPIKGGYRQCRCRTQAQSSSVCHLPPEYFNSSMGNICVPDGTPISRVDTFVDHAIYSNAECSSFCFLRQICSMSTRPVLDWHTISCITRTTFICHRPCPPSVRQRPTLWVHFSSSNGHQPLRTHPA